MKKRQDIHDYVAQQIQDLLAYAEPGSAHEILDVIAVSVMGGAKYLAGTASREQAITALHDMAKHIETVRELPKVNIILKQTRH